MKSNILILLTICSTTIFGQGNLYPLTGPVGLGTGTPQGKLQIMGDPVWDGWTKVHITNGANNYGRTNLILTGRLQENNDSWAFGTNARNAIVFSTNTANGFENAGYIGTEQFSLQHQQATNSLGFLSATNVNVPLLMMTQAGKIGLGTTDPVSILDIQGQVGVSALRLQGGYPYGTYYLDATSYLVSGQGVGYAFNLKNGGGNFTNVLSIFNDKIGIGTSTPDYKLTVKGAIHSQEVKVDLNGALAPDFVFEDNYNLKSLEETEEYIKEYKHLPEIPSANEMLENGFELKEMNLKLLQKVEELTLYMIAFKKQMDELKNENKELKEKIVGIERNK